ncbi:hypothetical protein O6H91_05G010000 [Diphasiastrum complanatum]|uniref:Uncharacterized protein n=1 Tax=Diphasiastrum complanatum TaxID=34168 RepID=A0ACC2DKJ2_DIPCM|nr:hypothetical protein O6H91_05G010000 [Diphasiastrum complanatum]
MDEEYVYLDLEDIFHGAQIPPNCSYTLSGLDTMTPILTIGGDLKLIGEYEDVVGSYIIFSEKEEVVEKKEFAEDRSIDQSQAPQQSSADYKSTEKKVEGVCCLQKKIKFRVMDQNRNQLEILKDKETVQP